MVAGEYVGHHIATIGVSVRRVEGQIRICRGTMSAMDVLRAANINVVMMIVLLNGSSTLIRSDRPRFVTIKTPTAIRRATSKKARTIAIALRSRTYKHAKTNDYEWVNDKHSDRDDAPCNDSEEEYNYHE